MQIRNVVLVAIATGLSLSTIEARAQYSDSPSLGDLARQQKQQREQARAAQEKDGKTQKVFTNSDLPAHADGLTPETSGAEKTPSPASSHESRQNSEEVKSRIQEQKSEIAGLQKQIEELSGSVRFAPENCVRNCEQWNLKQQQKQQEVEQMQTQLEEQKKHLEEMQDAARKQGFGSSVYDP
jgi:hypothetical protein